MKQKLSVIKIGGNLIEDEQVLNDFVADFAAMEGPRILVHGGGKLATRLAEKLGIETRMIQGRRITDKETLDVITMVYGGLVNKTIVAKLQARGCNAVGLSGADLNAVYAVKRPVKDIDFGYVGDVEQINGPMLSLLLNNGITPVLCAISHDGKGQLFNTNADTIASEVAIAMSSHFDTALYYCFEKQGVLKDINDEDSVIEYINTESYKELLAAQVIADGMIPKLHNCFHALQKEVMEVHIGNIKMIHGNHQKHTIITL